MHGQDFKQKHVYNPSVEHVCILCMCVCWSRQWEKGLTWWESSLCQLEPLVDRTGPEPPGAIGGAGLD